MTVTTPLLEGPWDRKSTTAGSGSLALMASDLSKFTPLSNGDATCNYLQYNSSHYILNYGLFSPGACATKCISTLSCTGFEIRQGTSDTGRSHCLLWLGFACSSPESPGFESSVFYGMAHTFVLFSGVPKRPPAPQLPPFPPPPSWSVRTIYKALSQ